jgi:hypothetical protein
MNNRFYKILIVSLFSLVLFWVSKTSIATYTASDPHLTLLTSQSILEHGTTNLYSYYVKVKPHEFSDGTWQYSYWKKEKKVYYFYPIGSSILSMPIVGIARLCGYDMLNRLDDSLWQSIIAGLCVSIIFLLFFILASSYLNFYLALIIPFLFCLGSSVMSTVGLALWSFDFEMIFLLLAANHISKNYNDPENISGFKLGTYLFIAWLCRPSAIIFIALIFCWLLFKNRKALKYFVITVVCFLFPFVLYSSVYFNQFILSYYNPFFWSTKSVIGQPFYEKFFAVLFSPARGLFLFTPFLIVSFVGFFYKSLRSNGLYLLMSSWFLIHLVMVARQWCWWGGWCFGPRLMTDALIPLFLMLILVFKEIKHSKVFKPVLSFFIFFALIGIYIHTIKGAHDVNTYKWNDGPAIDENIDFYCWDFDYPQFCADSLMNIKKMEEHLIAKDLEKSIYKLKKNDYLLLPNNHEYSSELAQKVNSKDRYSNIRLIFNPDDIQAQKLDSFYITTRLFNSYYSDTNYLMVKPVLKTLGAYIKEHQNHHLFIFTKFETLGKMSNETKAVFESSKSKFYNQYYKRGFFIHLFQMKNMHEELILKDPMTYSYALSGHIINSYSDGKLFNSITVDDKEYCFNENGFNVVAVDLNGNLIDATRFDTQQIDAEYYYVFKVFRRKM